MKNQLFSSLLKIKLKRLNLKIEWLYDLIKNIVSLLLIYFQNIKLQNHL